MERERIFVCLIEFVPSHSCAKVLVIHSFVIFSITHCVCYAVESLFDRKNLFWLSSVKHVIMDATRLINRVDR